MPSVTRRATHAPRRAGLALLAAAILALAAGCSASRAGGVGAGPGSDDGGVGGSSGDPDASSSFPPCTQPAGSACAVDSMICARSPECRPCAGGFQLVSFPTSYLCVCRAGIWEGVPSSIPSGDCFVEEPLSCANAESFYVDPACTQHPPCVP